MDGQSVRHCLRHRPSKDLKNKKERGKKIEGYTWKTEEKIQSNDAGAIRKTWYVLVSLRMGE